MNPKIVFLHIPKSAGTSLRRTLYDVLDNDKLFWLGLDSRPPHFFYPRLKVANKLLMGAIKALLFIHAS
ncbi:hypothetical protein BST96_13015 [Oceanicoccus sagamiensis]|uniref:Sulfotransferase family protein n=1 Tax=Oceanicoccus sagamiensis TaxID=716816 RepID=A0A1X9ND28_9GAMM|nr:hypothetical protein BST96_13015 [Oceanicoccus sagamiensis]